MTIALAQTIDELAHLAPMLTVQLPPEALERVAELALRIAQDEMRRVPPKGLIVSDLVPFERRTAAERSALTAHAMRVVKAMVLLGLVNPRGMTAG